MHNRYKKQSNARLKKYSLFMTSINAAMRLPYPCLFSPPHGKNSDPTEDGIAAQLIKSTHKHLLKPVENIINLIFKTSTILEYFKFSIIILILKSVIKNQITIYHPISVINNFSKILEKAVKETLKYK